MEERIFHGSISPDDLANHLVAHFTRANLRAFKMGDDDQLAVQITTSDIPSAGGQTALSVHIQKVEDGVFVKVGQQTYLGLAASLGKTAFMALRNPWSLLGRLDDLAQDFENAQLSDEVWRQIDAYAHSVGAGQELSERLRRIVCGYCGSANPVGEPSCIACGAPLGTEQPRTCRSCGFVLNVGDRFCTNCGTRI